MKKTLYSLLVMALIFSVSHSVFAQSNTRDNRVELQLGFLIDGSATVSAQDFQTIRSALADTLSNQTIVPQNGSVEVTVVQFSDSQARTEVAPTVITASSIDNIVNQIQGIDQGGGGTPLWLGIDRVTDLIIGSPNFAGASRQIVNVATDGQPQVPNDGVSVATGIQRSLDARDRAQTRGIDELDAEGIGQAITDTSFRNFLLDLVFPQPGTLIENVNIGNPGPGFVVLVQNFSQFQSAIEDKVTTILTSVGISPGNIDDEPRDDDPDTAPGPDGRPVPFDTPAGMALLIAVFGFMLFVLRNRTAVDFSIRK